MAKRVKKGPRSRTKKSKRKKRMPLEVIAMHAKSLKRDKRAANVYRAVLGVK